jgi:cytochrome c oxidase subunit 2
LATKREAVQVFPENISTYGGEIDGLFYLILGLSTFAFVISLFVLIYPLFRYRKSKNAKASYIKGEGGQLKWIIVALIALGASDFYILYDEHDTWVKIEETVPEPDVHVAITGRQWNWIFTYPGPDGKLYTGDDVTIDQQNSELHIPINKNIVFDLRARDVVHNFSVPNARFKQDAIPGRTITRWLQATKTGRYEIQCAELCGILHAKMRNFLVVEEEADYQAYLNQMYSEYASN